MTSPNYSETGSNTSVVFEMGHYESMFGQIIACYGRAFARVNEAMVEDPPTRPVHIEAYRLLHEGLAKMPMHDITMLHQLWTQCQRLQSHAHLPQAIVDELTSTRAVVADRLNVRVAGALLQEVNMILTATTNILPGQEERLLALLDLFCNPGRNPEVYDSPMDH